MHFFRNLKYRPNWNCGWERTPRSDHRHFLAVRAHSLSMSDGHRSLDPAPVPSVGVVARLGAGSGHDVSDGSTKLHRAGHPGSACRFQNSEMADGAEACFLQSPPDSCEEDQVTRAFNDEYPFSEIDFKVDVSCRHTSPSWPAGWMGRAHYWGPPIQTPSSHSNLSRPRDTELSSMQGSLESRNLLLTICSSSMQHHQSQTTFLWAFPDQVSPCPLPLSPHHIPQLLRASWRR